MGRQGLIVSGMRRPPDMIKLVWTESWTPQQRVRFLDLDRLVVLREIDVEIVLKLGSMVFPPWTIGHLWKRYYLMVPSIGSNLQLDNHGSMWTRRIFIATFVEKHIGDSSGIEYNDWISPCRDANDAIA
jgi:hypothetical protein